MKLTLYQVKNNFIPGRYIEHKSDKIEYFIYGKGWKKTKDYEKKEIEIAETDIDNLLAIHKFAKKYGKMAALELTTNHPLCWRQTAVTVAANAEIKFLEKLTRLNQILKNDNPIRFISWIPAQFGLVMFDIVAVEEYLASLDPSYDKENSSLKEYLKIKYPEAAKIVESLLEKAVFNQKN